MRQRKIRQRLLPFAFIALFATVLPYIGSRVTQANIPSTTDEPPAPSSPSPCPALPSDVKTLAGYGEGGSTDPKNQGDFDSFSWQSFVALNCPANPDAPPPQNPLDNRPRLWETFIDALDLYRAPDKELESLQAKTHSKGAKVLRLSAKNVHFKGGNLEFLEATGYPLVDKNLNFVVYEVRVNPVEEQYVKSNKLNTYHGQKKFFSNPKNQINFPPNPTMPENSIEIKAAWRILDTSKGDDPTKFYTRKATIYIERQFTENHKPLFIQNVTVGLVGLHIITKTKNFAKWIWSTFEQLNNDVGQYDPYTNSSFFNRDCTSCPLNDPPSLIKKQQTYRWAATAPYAAKYAYKFGDKRYGTQVVRASDIYPETQATNKKWQTLQGVAGTVWADYELVGTQWEAFNFKFPKMLANTTMETYNQASASCMDCHAFATTTFGNQPADFSFLLGLVQAPTKPVAKPATPNNAPPNENKQ
ncbi:MAG: hypothetical protein HY231_18990 [Acidobacteria bacterium]|nr:hypothetical protein [Acidobacteriota bacterium]